MTQDDARDAAAVRIFPPAAPLVTVLAGVALNHFLPIYTAFLLPAPARYWIGGVIVAGAIIGLGVWSVLIMRRTGQSENPWKPTTEIVQSGPFSFTRNPLYLQMVLVCVGVAVMLGNVWILILTPVCAWALHHFAIVPEEVYLEHKFGDQYRVYKRRVRRWI